MLKNICALKFQIASNIVKVFIDETENGCFMFFDQWSVVHRRANQLLDLRKYQDWFYKYVK